MEKIVVVEDEKALNTMIRDYLEAVGYTTLPAFDGLSGLKLIRDEDPDFVILDMMLPGIEGTDLLRRLREFSQVPVIILTARAEEGDKLLGLELGADDYMTKPFSLKELAARIRTVLRRSRGDAGGKENSLQIGPLFLDPAKRSLRRNGEEVSLTSVQFDILQLMMRRPGQVFTRMDLLNAFQENAFEGYERTIDVHIKNIRKQLEEDPSHPRFVLTVWGVGYKFVEEADL